MDSQTTIDIRAITPMTVILAAPIPPPEGGITNWTRIIRKGIAETPGLSDVLIDISLKRTPSSRGFLKSVDGVMRIILSARKSVEEMARNNSNCLVMHLCTSGGMGFARDLGLIRVAKANNIPAMLHLHFGRVPALLTAKSFEARLMRQVLVAADGVMAMDSETMKALRRHGYGDKACLVPNPIEDSVVPKGVERRLDVVFVGHVTRAKGIEDLLAAWALIAKQNKTAKLRVIGPIEDEYRARLVNSDKTRQLEFVGRLPHEETIEAIESASVLVLPSYTEGFPNVVLEAMALGTPVVATSVGAIPEMLSGNVGFTVSPGDIAGLASSIDMLLKNEALRKKMGDCGIARVRDRYRLSKVISEMRAEWLKLELRSNFRGRK